MVNTELSTGDKSVHNNSKNNLAYGLAIIFILFLAIILSASFMGVFNGYEPYQQLTAAMLSVAATGVITAMLLYFQRKQQEQLNKEQRDFQKQQEKDQNEFQVKLIQDQQKFEEEQKNKEKQRLQETKIFEEKLSIYQNFLKKLCDVVKDQNITKDEEIEMQFQVSYIAMHTKSDSIQVISENVKDIIYRVKKGDEKANNMLEKLFEIADAFHEELYQKKNTILGRDKTIKNFEFLLYGKEDIEEYEEERIKMLYDKAKSGIELTIPERFELFKAKIKDNVADSCDLLYKGNLLNYQFYTKLQANGKYARNKDTIAIDMLVEGNDYVIRVGSRRNEPEETKKIALGIDGEFNPGNTKITASHWHVHKKMPLSTDCDEMVRIMNELLAKVKDYRDK